MHLYCKVRAVLLAVPVSVDNVNATSRNHADSFHADNARLHVRILSPCLRIDSSALCGHQDAIDSFGIRYPTSLSARHVARTNHI